MNNFPQWFRRFSLFASAAVGAALIIVISLATPGSTPTDSDVLGVQFDRDEAGTPPAEALSAATPESTAPATTTTTAPRVRTRARFVPTTTTLGPQRPDPHQFVRVAVTSFGIIGGPMGTEMPGSGGVREPSDNEFYLTVNGASVDQSSSTRLDANDPVRFLVGAYPGERNGAGLPVKLRIDIANMSNADALLPNGEIIVYVTRDGEPYASYLLNTDMYDAIPSGNVAYFEGDITLIDDGNYEFTADWDIEYR